mmetsp:Transcript_22701/g.33415  ORF Transcript_22701/g.33415 Transcript_22701/m.33415 type:complete len:99 (-) Transcript_22701:289-585(-)
MDFMGTYTHAQDGLAVPMERNLWSVFQSEARQRPTDESLSSARACRRYFLYCFSRLGETSLWIAALLAQRQRVALLMLRFRVRIPGRVFSTSGGVTTC